MLLPSVEARIGTVTCDIKSPNHDKDDTVSGAYLVLWRRRPYFRA
jgi:hypothetical protein